MDELETMKLQAQNYCSRIPTMIIGSGASAAFGLSGMGALATHLQNNVSPTDDDKKIWEDICTLLKNGIDLESALLQKDLTEDLRQQAVKETWALLNPQDIQAFNQSLQKDDYFPLGQFLQYCFRTNTKTLQIITTNYDRLIEYACEQENIHWFTGFGHGYRKFQVNEDVLKANKVAKKIINIWKVHGSLDWYDIEGKVVSLGNLEQIPEGCTPYIVTPGNSKFKQTHDEPYRSIIQEADSAIKESQAFLCVGFGFNDKHIQPKLIERCVKDKIPIVILTHTLTEATKKFLFELKPNNFIAIEYNEESQGSSIYSSKIASEPLVVADDFWSLNGFLSIIS